MKKLVSILSLFVLCIGLVACSSSSEVTKATPADVNTKIENKESFIVVVSSDTCSACQAYRPVIKEFINKVDDASLIEVVIDNLEGQEKNDFIIKYSITGTPTTLFFKDGELKTMVGHVISEPELEEMFNTYLK